MSSTERKIIINKDFNPFILNAVIKRYWYWPIIFVSLFLMLAFFYLRYTKSIYESSSLIQIESKDQGKEILDLENINSKNNVSSQIELMKSQFLFDRAIKKLNMHVSLFAKGNVLTEEMYHLSTFNVIPYELKDSSLCGVPVYIQHKNGMLELNYNFNGKAFVTQGKLNQPIKNEHFEVVIKTENADVFDHSSNSNELYFCFNNQQELVERLLAGLIITPVNLEAQTVEIKYQAYNPLLCKDIVTAVTQAFFEYDEILKKQSSDNILEFIEKQLDSLSTELKSSKDSLTNFQRSSKIGDPENTSTEINLNLNKLRDNLFEIQEELNTLRMVSMKLKSEPNRIDIYKILPEMLGKSYESALSRQIEDLHQILERKEDLLFKVKPENAEIINLNNRIDEKIQSIKRSMSVIQERLLNNAQSIQDKISTLDGEYLMLPNKRMEFNRLRSMQELNEKYYTLLTEKKAQYAISNAGYAPTSRILSTPKVPVNPVNPNRKMIYIAFFLFGFLFGLIIIIVRYLTYNEISNLEDLKKLLPQNINYLGVVPKIKDFMKHSEILVHETSKTRLAEAMRNIRSNMGFINANAKVIAVSSSVSGEGKTFVCLNLAGIIALSGKKTIIIDLDMRKPKIHHGFKAHNIFGMSNLIVKQTTMEECIQHSEIKNLDFITAGAVPPNPSELILSDEFEKIMEELKLKYDVIIIDNPPVGLVSDGISIMAHADIPIYIFKANYSKRMFSERIVELIEVQKIKSLNVILNNVDTFNSRYGYGYGYGKTYGQGYYTEETTYKSKKRKKTSK